MGQWVTSMPRSVTLPALGSIIPQVMRKHVVLPAPFGPSRPTIWPRPDYPVVVLVVAHPVGIVPVGHGERANAHLVGLGHGSFDLAGTHPM